MGLACCGSLIVAGPPVFPAGEKVRVVVSILGGEMSVAEAARRSRVFEQSVGNGKREFLQAGRTGLAAGESGPSVPRGAVGGRGRRSDLGAR